MDWEEEDVAPSVHTGVLLTQRRLVGSLIWPVNIEHSAHFFSFLFLTFIEILCPCEAVERPAQSQTENIEGWGHVCSDW